MPGKAFALVAEAPFVAPPAVGIVDTDWTIQIFVILFSLGLLFVGFSRERDEDEYISKIRFYALAWSLFINTGLVILTTLLVYGIPYIYVMYFYAFSLLLLFDCRYFYKMYQFRRDSHEE